MRHWHWWKSRKTQFNWNSRRKMNSNTTTLSVWLTQRMTDAVFFLSCSPQNDKRILENMIECNLFSTKLISLFSFSAHSFVGSFVHLIVAPVFSQHISMILVSCRKIVVLHLVSMWKIINSTKEQLKMFNICNVNMFWNTSVHMNHIDWEIDFLCRIHVFDCAFLDKLTLKLNF